MKRLSQFLSRHMSPYTVWLGGLFSAAFSLTSTESNHNRHASLFLEHCRLIPALDCSLCLEFSALRFLSGCFLLVMLNWVILAHGGSSGHGRVFNNISGLCPSASTRHFQLWKPKLAQEGGETNYL